MKLQPLRIANLMLLPLLLVPVWATRSLAEAIRSDRPVAVVDPRTIGTCMWDGQHDVAPCVQGALEAAARSGAAVRLPSGTWPIAQALRPPSGLTLEGEDGRTILEPRVDTTSRPLLLNVTPSTANVVVRNIIFDGGGAQIGNDAALIKVSGATNIIFERITVRSSRGAGLVFESGVQSSGVRDSTFTNIGNRWKATSEKSDRSVGLLFCCGASNIHNFAIANHFTQIGLDALQIGDQNGFVASANTFDLESRQFDELAAPDYPAAIFSPQSRNVEITNNVIRNAPGNGIDAPGLGHSTLSGNIIMGCGGAGIGLFGGYDNVTQPSDVSIIGNTITDNVRWTRSTFTGGITISARAPTDVAISRNVVTNTTVARTQAFGVEVLNRTIASGVAVDHTNRLAGNRIADLHGVTNDDRP
jgi:hypothetical protein